MRIFTIKSLRTIQLLMAIILLSGCTTVSTVRPNAQDLNHYNIQDGREVGIATRSGDLGYLKVDTVSEGAIAGTDRLGNRHEFTTDEIKHVEVKHVSALKTAGAAATVFTVILLAGVWSVDYLVEEVLFDL